MISLMRWDSRSNSLLILWMGLIAFRVTIQNKRHAVSPIVPAIMVSVVRNSRPCASSARSVRVVTLANPSTSPFFAAKWQVIHCSSAVMGIT